MRLHHRERQGKITLPSSSTASLRLFLVEEVLPPSFRVLFSVSFPLRGLSGAWLRYCLTGQETVIDRRGIVDDPTLHQWWPDGRVRPRRCHRASAGSLLEFWRGIVDQQILEVGRLSRGSEDVVVFDRSVVDCLYIYPKYQFEFIRVSRDFSNRRFCAKKFRATSTWRGQNQGRLACSTAAWETQACMSQYWVWEDG